MPGGGWAHSCCSAAALAAALSDPSVHSIESDILVSSRTGQPVMAHPPATDSDLSFGDFLVACTGGDDGRKRKHLKFDFKDAAAVGPCLERTAAERGRLRAGGQTVWLNADVLAGPGCHPMAVEPGHRTPPAVAADAFLERCRAAYPEGVLSLGWKVDVVGVGGYTEAHCDAMYALLERHGLLDTELVLAVAARQTAQNPAPLLKLLRRLPRSELLVWTGTGEPAILPGLVGRIRRAFASIEARGWGGGGGGGARGGRRTRVNFDVAVQEGGPLRALLWNGDRSIFLFRAYRPFKWALYERDFPKLAMLLLRVAALWFALAHLLPKLQF